MTLHPNATLALAALLTIWLATHVCAPLPAAENRVVIGFACFLIQTPRWICLALVLGLCVAQGAFHWPANRAGQYVVVLLVHLVLGFGAICAGLAMTGVPGVPSWLLRTLALSTIIVPTMEIVFAAWFLNPGLHQGLDSKAMAYAVNSALLAFASVVAIFAIAGIAAWFASSSANKNVRTLTLDKQLPPITSGVPLAASFMGRQPNQKPQCCGAPATFRMSGGIVEIRAQCPELEPEILNHIIYNLHISGVAATRLLHSLHRNGGPMVFVFHCPRCERHRFQISGI